MFHDDQHGTAIVVVAALRNALRVVGKDITDCRIVVSGVGAAGNAIIRLLLLQQPADIVACDIDGIVHAGREGMDPNLSAVAGLHQRCAADRLDPRRDGRRRRVHRGVRAERHRRLRRRHDDPDAVVFALANPDPEIDPLEAQAARRRGGHRPVGLPEPDQQRAGLPRGVPRTAGRPGDRDHRRAC